MSAEEHGTAVVSGRPMTFNAAVELGGFELARQWADRLLWPFPTERTAQDDLAELAYMSALAEWLRRWQPIHIHHALLTGVPLGEVAAALGSNLSEVFYLWHGWASSQRGPSMIGSSALADDEYNEVAGIFASGGFAVSAC